jgi:hypothetical protein
MERWLDCADVRYVIFSYVFCMCGFSYVSYMFG